ncbi:hypothetical protein C7M84_014909 [Penaeus vannamei]|uniref:Uncharacterized protein n=1 Tax=Penaeus vannamei TaxID=6689 RepID=A0A3R7QGY7_PENVA|nr:hypothetical protein C7M84_014909 [Penaeus vannamei]
MRQYTALDLGSCSAKRTPRQRQEVHLLRDSPTLQVSRDCFLTFVNDNRYHAENPFDQGIFRENKTWLASPNFTFSMFPLHDSDPALEPYDLRVTLVWAPYASFTAPPSPTYRMRVTKFEEWLEQEVVPDVVVMGLGTWFLLQRQGLDELAPYTEAEFLLRPLVEPLARLARRTRVLWWHQSRYRWFNLEGGGGTPWQDMLTHNQFRDSIPLMDAWLWLAVFRNTGMWQWDSTVPFNLANYRECYDLWKLGLSKDKIYKSRWWHCGDDHHSSYETNADEIQMLLNLLCNAYIASREQYCCSGG